MDNEETKDYVTANTLAIGESAVFREFGRNLSEKERPDIAPGTGMKLQKVSLDRTRLYFKINGTLSEIDAEIAENIWVSR